MCFAYQKSELHMYFQIGTKPKKSIVFCIPNNDLSYVFPNWDQTPKNGGCLAYQKLIYLSTSKLGSNPKKACVQHTNKRFILSISKLGPNPKKRHVFSIPKNELCFFPNWDQTQKWKTAALWRRKLHCVPWIYIIFMIMDFKQRNCLWQSITWPASTKFRSEVKNPKS